MSREISNSDHIIDSRDIIARIEELETDLQTRHEDALAGAAQSEDEADEKPIVPEDFEVWLVDVIDAELADETNDLATELRILRNVAKQGEGYGDWHHGETLIRDSYFVTYAQELAEDIGAIAHDAQWPLSYIDWEAAADALKADYTSIDFDGVTYWMRA